MNTLDMSREYRQELDSLRARARGLGVNAARVVRQAEKDMRRINRETAKALERIATETAALEKRRLILGGRLAK